MLSNFKHRICGFGLQAVVLVYDDRFKGMHLKLTEQSHRCGAVLVGGMMAVTNRNNAFVARKESQPLYPAALQHECELAKLMDDAGGDSRLETRRISVRPRMR